MQDYKHIRYESEKRRKESNKSKKTSLVILFALIILIAAGVYLQKHPLMAEKIEKIVEEHKPKLAEVTEQKRFTFYDILARGEVIVDADIPIEIKEDRIYIQLGAFRNDADADNLEAKMTLLGLHPEVQSLDLPEKGGHWFIVRIGPIKDDKELGLIKMQLTHDSIDFRVVSKKD
jgi:cell division protein FtsN